MDDVLRYGRHDPEADRQATVTVFSPFKGGADREVPLPAVLVEQRRRLNEIAAGQPRRVFDREPLGGDH